MILGAAHVVAGAAGTATATVGPGPAYLTWRVATVRVHSDSDLRPIVRLWRGSEYLSGSSRGDDDTDDTPRVLHSGDHLRAEWTGARPGSRCTMVLES